MVRPSDEPDRQYLDWSLGCSDRSGGGRHWSDCASWLRRRCGKSECSRPLRLRPETAVVGDFALGKRELCGSLGDRSVVDHPLYRRQLALRTTHRKRFVRWYRQLHRADVQLRESQNEWNSVLESVHWREGKQAAMWSVE